MKRVVEEGRLNFGSAKAKIEFLPQYKGRPRSEKGAKKKGIITKKNISHFYSNVYASIFGGEVGRIYKGDVEKLASGRKINFHPDIVNDLPSGRIYTEVKCTSARSLQYICGLEQAANYCFKFLQRREIGDKLPGVNYAFFRYGRTDECNWKKKHHDELEERLCDVRSLVVVPLNLALLLFMTSKIKTKDQSTSDSNRNLYKYFELNGGFFTGLAKTKQSIYDLLEDRASYFGVTNDLTPQDFFVDELRVNRFKSPTIIVNGKQKIKPFPITKYSLSNEKAQEWLEHFYERRANLLRAMEIDDLYAEDKKERDALAKVPF